MKAVGRDPLTGAKLGGEPRMNITVQLADETFVDPFRVFSTGEAILGYHFPLGCPIRMTVTR